MSDEVDAVTKARAGSLAAHGLSDANIADLLLLTSAQVAEIKSSETFKRKYAEDVASRVDRQMQLAEGWDAVEEMSIAHVIESLEYNKDPKFALLAARTANAATRHGKRNDVRVVDASNLQNNIITINLNKTYVQSVQQTEGNGLLDITPRPPPANRKQADLPAPKMVSELLAPVAKAVVENKELKEIEDAFAMAGVALGINDA
jgi:hypothetical protein